MIRISNTRAVEKLFDGWDESLIWSCLQGVMGDIYADSEVQPQSAMAILGDFCYFAGKPDAALVMFKPPTCQKDFMIMVPQNDAWSKLIEENYGGKATKRERYAIKTERNIFDKEKLLQIQNSLPDGYTLHFIEEELFWRCRENLCYKDFVAQYADYNAYREHGLGVVCMKDGEIVSGASSYSGYIGGIEIEVDTKEEYRRRGFATACASKLILECLSRGWYPKWDAENKWSVALAEKLGYHYSHVYTAYQIRGY